MATSNHELLVGVSTFDFIHEVEKRPAIWNRASPDFKDKDKRLDTWHELAAMFVTTYQESTPKQQAQIRNKIGNKWRNLRDTYARSVRTGRKCKNYGDALSFLEGVYGVPNVKQISDSDSEDERDSKKRKYEEQNDATFEDTAAFPEFEVVNSSYHAPVADTKEFNDDRFFFESLLPALQQLDMDQKLQFRMQVMKLVKDFRSKATSSVKLEESD